MTLTASTKTMSQDELEKIIEKAIKKINGTKENDLCKYIPGPGPGVGYMHHFTLRKLKHADPEKLFKLLQKFVVEADSPAALDPKPRSPRGSRKRREFPSITRTDIERVIELARKAGDRDLVARFSPKRTLPALKRELIRSVRENRVAPELWNAYAESITALSTHASNEEFQ